MTRIYKIAKQADRAHLTLTHSGEDVRNCMMSLASTSIPATASLEHLLVALYIRQPRMIGDFLGEVKINDLSNKLLGMDIDEKNIEDLYQAERRNARKIIITSHEVDKVFEIAEQVAELVGHHKVGSAELFISLLMFCNKDVRLKELMSERGIDNKRVQRAFLECNVPKYQTPQLFDNGYFRAINVSQN